MYLDYNVINLQFIIFLFQAKNFHVFVNPISAFLTYNNISKVTVTLMSDYKE